jgi:hypothetical protein
VAPALLVAVLGARALPVVRAYGVSPEPWQAVTAGVLAQSRPGDCIAFYPADARMAFQYYVRSGPASRRAPRAVMPVAPWGVVRPYVEDYTVPAPAELARRVAGCQRMWLVSSHEGQANGPPVARAHRSAVVRAERRAPASVRRRAGDATATRASSTQADARPPGAEGAAAAPGRSVKP